MNLYIDEREIKEFDSFVVPKDGSVSLCTFAPDVGIRINTVDMPTIMDTFGKDYDIRLESHNGRGTWTPCISCRRP